MQIMGSALATDPGIGKARQGVDDAYTLITKTVGKVPPSI
jgi:hypothetical protein